MTFIVFERFNEIPNDHETYFFFRSPTEYNRRSSQFCFKVYFSGISVRFEGSADGNRSSPLLCCLGSEELGRFQVILLKSTFCSLFAFFPRIASSTVRPHDCPQVFERLLAFTGTLKVTSCYSIEEPKNITILTPFFEVIILLMNYTIF